MLFRSHLRFGDEPIRSTYLVNHADYVACHNPSYVNLYHMIEEIKENGIFVLNCFWDDEEMEHYMPHSLLRQIADKNIQFYYIKAHKIAEEIGLGNRINMIMQGAFFKLSDILEKETAKQYLKDAITKMYQKKGEKIVKMNHLAIDKGFEQLNKVKIKEEWKNYSI